MHLPRPTKSPASPGNTITTGITTVIIAATVAVAMIVALMPSYAAAQNCPTGVSWPGNAWTSRDVSATTAAQKQAIDELLFTLEGKDEDRLGVRTDGMIIAKGGEIIFEKYARGFSDANPHPTWSVSKSIVSAIAGIAIQAGILQLSDTVCQHMPRLSGHICDATVEDLLEMSSGVEWKEVYENESYAVSSVLAMLYGEGRNDMAKFVSELSSRTAPGTEYIYSTGDPTLLMAVIAGAVATEQTRTFPWDFLFNHIGAQKTRFLQDNIGTFVGGSYVYSTPRDLARFGHLFLRDGCWNNLRLLPEGWVNYSRTLSPTFEAAHPYWDENGVPGHYFWINVAVPEHDNEPNYPDAPADTFVAIGHWGQYVAVIPSLDLVVVRVGDDRNEHVKINEMLKVAIAYSEAAQ